jgi:hypothetical protein
MYTTGATAKAATSVFFIFMICMTGCLGTSIFRIVTRGGLSGTGNPGQNQQVNTEYEQDCFHAAKIMAYVLILIKQGV